MSERRPLPLVRPMLATLGPLPREPGWGYELKWDGVRTVVYLDGGQLRLMSRNDRDVAVSYPELRELLEVRPARRLILDGEIVALNPDGTPSFGLLQQRMHVVAPGSSLLSRVPVRFYAFDVLRVADRSLLDAPYTRRREQLEGLGLERTDVADVPPHWTGDVGPEVMEAARQQRLEGVVAKRLESTYQPGRRSPSWIKTPLNQTQEVIVCGWRAGGGRRAGTIGSLLLGAHDAHGRLVYLGRVGTGFTQRMLDDLLRRLRPLARDTTPLDLPVPGPDERDAHWVSARLVGEVEFRAWTADGHLRHPSWRGLRADKGPDQVTLPG